MCSNDTNVTIFHKSGIKIRTCLLGRRAIVGRITFTSHGHNHYPLIFPPIFQKGLSTRNSLKNTLKFNQLPYAFIANQPCAHGNSRIRTALG